jgi:hypothetical protein
MYSMMIMIDGEFNLHSIHFASDNDLSYDCLHSKVMNDIGNYDKNESFSRILSNN